MTELEQVKKERDWLAQMLENDLACYMPNDHGEYCASHKCSGCKYMTKEIWLEAAKKETCEELIN